MKWNDFFTTKARRFLSPLAYKGKILLIPDSCILTLESLFFALSSLFFLTTKARSFFSPLVPNGGTWVFTLYSFFFILCPCLFLACSPNNQQQSTQNQQTPNVILILADDLGYGELGAYGQEKIETPHLDALRASGMLFTQFYSGSAVCAPARSVLMTGQHTGHTHVRGNDEWGERGDVWNFEAMQNDPNLEGQRPLPDSIFTLAEALKSNGYATACVGKWGLGAPNTEGVPTKQGFDLFVGYNCQRQAHTYYPVHLWKNEERLLLDNELVPPHNTPLPEGADPYDEASYAAYRQNDYAPDVMQGEALQFIENNQEQPFFLYYPTPIPHLALQAPKPWVDHYRKKFGEEEPYTGSRYFPCRYPKATYAAMISYLDEQVGEIVAKLKALGIYNNSIIFFTSDNGPTLIEKQVDIAFFESAAPFVSERGRVKGSLREGGIRVPLLASWPGQIEAGRESDYIGAFWDFYPTICEVTGTPMPENWNTDGISFAPSLFGESQTETHDYLYWEYPERGGQQALRKGEWKAFRQNLKQGEVVTELYNLESDPQEQQNVAAEHPKVVEELEKRMQQARTPTALERWQFPVLVEK